MILRNSLILAGLGLVAGCSGEATSEPVASGTEPGGAWQLMERDYPLVGENGERLCAEWQQQRPDGTPPAVHREWYSFDIMNAILEGRVTTEDPDAIRSVRRTLPSVASCDDARAFTRLRYDYERSHPTLEPPAATPSREVAPGAESRADSEPPVGPTGNVDKVANSFTFFSPPTVLVTDVATGARCSGVLISGETLLTAAHCFPPSSVGPGLFRRILVSYGESEPCVIENCNDGQSNAHVFGYPNYSGSGDRARDLALVRLHTPRVWLDPANDPNTSWARLLDQSTVIGEQFFIEGYGWNANSGGSWGIGRRSNTFETVDYNYGGWWYMHVTQGRGRPCMADSGSPANNDHYMIGKPDSGFRDCVIGLNSGGESASPYCPDLGDEVYYTRVSDKLTWIDQFFSGCHRSSSNGFSYARCF